MLPAKSHQPIPKGERIFRLKAIGMRLDEQFKAISPSGRIDTSITKSMRCNPESQMTAKFASNGLVCEMQIEQAHFDKNKADLRKGIDKERVNGLIGRTGPTIRTGRKEFPTGVGVLAIVSMDGQEKYIPASAEAAKDRRVVSNPGQRCGSRMPETIEPCEKLG